MGNKKLFRKVLIEDFNLSREDVENKYHSNIPGFKDEDYNQLIDSLIIDRSNELDIYPSSRRAIYNFYLMNGPITFITARSKNTEESTNNYLKENFSGIEFKVLFCKDHKKETLLKNFDYFVDDQIGNLVPALDKEIIKKGFLITRDYNISNVKLDENIIRVNNLLEVWDWFY